jgi:methionine-gamma-lyase
MKEMKNKTNPESQMMTYGYKPELSEGAIKPPIFQTSTFVFKSAEDGKSFFEVAYGIRDKNEDEELGLIYSRINNPNLEILEDRLSLWDDADASAVFESGMAAISTVLLEYLKPGDTIVYSNPLYGGTDHFINHYLPSIGVNSIPVLPTDSMDDVVDKINNCQFDVKSVKLFYIETPSNPTNDLFDIKGFVKLRDSMNKWTESDIKLVVDNTYMGPMWQQPLKLGADLVVYSATKYIGGHSDLIAGIVMGKSENMTRIKTLRTFLGNMVSPHTAWLMLRSLETLKLRMDKQQENASEVVDFLKSHKKVEKTYYISDPFDERKYAIWQEQCSGSGAMISFDIVGGEKEAFTFLNNLKLIKLAVSLGSTESLAQHPATMTHVGVDTEMRKVLGITEKLIRISIGVENYEDLIKDIDNALSKV